MTRKIAIIGAGPAGYTLAQELVKTENEYQIDIFDKANHSIFLRHDQLSILYLYHPL